MVNSISLVFHDFNFTRNDNTYVVLVGGWHPVEKLEDDSVSKFGYMCPSDMGHIITLVSNASVSKLEGPCLIKFRSKILIY